jgi:hypothetical protein
LFLFCYDLKDPGLRPGPRDNREEGPERGLFTGLEGEFVIFRKSDEPDSGSEAHKCSDETVDGEQQKMGGKEKNAENKNGEEQP